MRSSSPDATSIKPSVHAVTVARAGEGRALKLSDGRVVERFPNPADQEKVVHDGRGSMPAWGSKLSDEEIAAVVRYTREAL